MSNMRKKAKKKAEKDQNRGGNYNLDLPENTPKFVPKSKGPYHLDILPYTVSVNNHPEAKKGELWYQRTYWIHYGLGDDGRQSGICPKTIGKPCPVCESYKELVSSEDEDDREAAKKIKAKERELYNLIDLDDQDAGVKIFEYSWHLFGKPLSEEVNEGSEEDAGFAELEGGKTLKVSFRKESIGGGTPFWEVRKIDFEDREDYDEEILEEVYDLDQILKIPSYSQLQALLTGADAEEDEEDEEEEEEKPSKKKSGKKSSSKKKSKKDEDEEEEGEEEEEEEEKPRKGKKKSSSKSKSSSKKKKSDDEEEEEDSGKKKSSKKPGKVGKKKSNKNKCPGGGEFGVDTDELDECKNCDIWTECQEANENED